jgi:hypothetical protein
MRTLQLGLTPEQLAKRRHSLGGSDANTLMSGDNERIRRNPVLALPAMVKLQHLPRPAKEALAAVLRELAADATQRADKCWRTHKAPMAAYWKAVAVYARHIARAIYAEEKAP